MSILDNVTTTRYKQGLRIVIAGAEKIGKTTLSCGAPTPLFIALESGYQAVTGELPHIDLRNYKDVIAVIDELIQTCQAGTCKYESIIIDTVTEFEEFIHAYIRACDGNKPMSTAHGGYGKAYDFANIEFKNFLIKCDTLALTYGKNIIFNSHVFSERVIDPLNGEYDKWDILLHSPKNSKTFGKREILTQWADIVGFLHQPFSVTKSDNLSMGVSKHNGRVLSVSKNPAYVAGNRYGIDSDIEVIKQDGWNCIAKAIYDASGLDYFKRQPQLAA